MPEFINSFNLLPALPEGQETDELSLEDKKNYESDFSTDESTFFNECDEEDGIKTDNEDNDGFDRMSDQQPLHSAISKPRFRIKTAVVRQQLLTSTLDTTSKSPYILPSIPDKFGFNRLYVPPVEKYISITNGKINWIFITVFTICILIVAIVVPVVILEGNKNSNGKKPVSYDSTQASQAASTTITTTTTSTTIPPCNIKLK